MSFAATPYMATQTSPGNVIRFATYELDVAAGELRRRGVRLPVTGLPVNILAILAANPGTLVSREELRNRLWPPNTFVDFDHSIRNAVARLREVLDDSADHPRYIETVPRRGYRFIADVEAPPTAEPVPRAPDAPPTDVPVVEPGPTRRRSRIAIALAVLVLCALATLGYWLTHRSKLEPIRSLAVLPFENLSGDPSQEYLADGVTESVIGRLAAIRNLRVISRTSVMTFKGKHTIVPEIAKALDVDAIVEGSVIREGNRVRVHAQLIRARTDAHFWSESYDRDLGDALSLEADLAQAIALKVAATISGEENARITASRHVAPEVYESYLKGRSVSGQNRAAVEQSIAYFEDAIRKDPSFAPAYLGLADAYSELGTIFVGAPPRDVRPKVVDAAKKALELDPDIAEAHTLLGKFYQAQWRWSEAESEYRRALALKPNDSAALLGLANWLMCQGRTDEAVELALYARSLDPVGVSGSELAWFFFQSRRYDEAFRELNSYVAVHPDDATSLWYMGFVHIARNQPDRAIPVLEKTIALMDRSPGSIELLATAYGRAGRRADALRLIEELKRRQKTGYVPAGAFINPYLGLGDYDQAFVWFERAYQEQSNILQFLKVHPFFDPVRNDPRFLDLERRVGLQ
jgi:TolB-like protein/DNA-binding winged helix-turn-helix (wHTH) protein/Flp pilus assembly protein TadD